MKFQKFMNEADDTFQFDKVIAKIQRATNDNAHTHSWIILATEILKDKKLADAFRAIQSVSDYFGHTPSGLIDTRMELGKIAMEHVKEKYPEAVKKINAAF